jgi:hypothetical protein
VAKPIHEQIVSDDVEIVAEPDGYVNVNNLTTPDGFFNRPTRDVIVHTPEAVVISPDHPFDDD